MNASAKLQADREVAAVSQNGCWLRWSSDELKADKEVVMAAVSQHEVGWYVPRMSSRPTRRW
jgi:hypothetical protein